MTPIDRNALERALVACRAESAARAKQIDSKLASESWEDVAEFAAYCAQGRALDLMPWQSPPCHANLRALSEPFGDPRAARESAELLRRLLDAGLSRFEPDPLGALEQAEAKRQTPAK
jgi:hypothetical protein